MLNVDHETEIDFAVDFNLFNKALRGQIHDRCVMSWDVHFSAHGNAHVSVWILQNNNLLIKIASASKYWPVKHINQHLLEVGLGTWSNLPFSVTRKKKRYFWYTINFVDPSHLTLVFLSVTMCLVFENSSFTSHSCR